MSSGFDFKEFEKYAEKLKETDKGFELFLTNFLLEMAERAVSRIKPRTPVDTGTLRGSWFISDISTDGNEISATIFNPTEYASYVEYGHMKRNGKWQNGFFMLTMSIDEIQQQIPKRFEKEFLDYMKQKGV